MNLYDITKGIESLIDYETGEILDIEAFNALAITKEAKLENVALWIKNLLSDAEQMKTEEQNLAQRRKSCERKAARLKDYLALWLNGAAFETPRVKCSWRKSSAVDIPDDRAFVEWALKNNRTALLTFSDPVPSKSAIKDFINAGGEAVGAEIASKQSLNIK